MKRHVVIFIPGLGNDARKIKLLVSHRKNYGLIPVVHSVDWYNNQTSFEIKLKNLLLLIDSYAKCGYQISLVGLSAGGSAVGNAFIKRKRYIHRVVSICARLRQGQRQGFRGFIARTEFSSAFAQSVKLFEEKERQLTKVDRRKILTVRAAFGDELVPANTTQISGATNITIPTIEHMLSGALALTLFSKPIISFLKHADK